MLKSIKLLSVLLTFLLFSLSVSADYGIGGSNNYGIGAITSTGTTTSTNYSTVNVNNSQFWQGHIWSEVSPWIYNMSSPFYTWLSTFNYNYNQTPTNVCYSNGTGCPAGMNYTNLALTNQTNAFRPISNIGSNEQAVTINYNQSAVNSPTGLRVNGSGTLAPNNNFLADFFYNNVIKASIDVSGTLYLAGGLSSAGLITDSLNGIQSAGYPADAINTRNPINLNHNGYWGAIGSRMTGTMNRWTGYSDYDTDMTLSVGKNSASVPFLYAVSGNTTVITLSGNVGINKTPAYPLDVGASVSGISIYSLANVSASGYITRTDVFDKSEGSALNMIKDASEYKNLDGSVNHNAFGVSAVSYDKQVVDKIIPTPKEVDNCSNVFDIKLNEIKNICEKVTIIENVTTYKTIQEEGVSLDKEVALLKQSIYELKVQNEYLQSQINNLTGQDIDLSKVNDVQDEAICSIKIFAWCIK